MTLRGNFNWNLVSRFRPEIMGVAIIFVLIVHAQPFFGGIMLNHITPLFTCGVDIFLFVSGIGLYFSMKKNGDVLLFYKRRFLRIVPEFLIVSAIGYAIIDILSKNEIVLPEFLIKVSGIRAAFIFQSGENVMLWYVVFIIIMYAFYPSLFLLEKLSETSRSFMYAIIMALPIAAELILDAFFPEVFNKYDIDRMLTRIPIFVFGSHMGRVVERGVEGKKILVPALFAVFIFVRAAKILFLDDAICGRLFVKIANQFLAVGILLFVALFMESLKEGQLRLFRLILSWCGKASLELYLIHTFLLLIYLALPFPNKWYLYFVVILPFAFAISAFVLAAKQLFRLKSQERRACGGK